LFSKNTLEITPIVKIIDKKNAKNVNIVQNIYGIYILYSIFWQDRIALMAKKYINGRLVRFIGVSRNIVELCKIPHQQRQVRGFSFIGSTG
jgi:hypothetical protein